MESSSLHHCRLLEVFPLKKNNSLNVRDVLKGLHRVIGATYILVSNSVKPFGYFHQLHFYHRCVIMISRNCVQKEANSFFQVTSQVSSKTSDSSYFYETYLTFYCVLFYFVFLYVWISFLYSLRSFTVNTGGSTLPMINYVVQYRSKIHRKANRWWPRIDLKKYSHS